MNKNLLRFGASIAVLSLATMMPCVSFAQDAAQKDGAANDGETIIVTASGRDKTKMKSSVSVSVISSEVISDFTPRSEAEVFRLIPGIQAQDTAGPGGNSNIGVRGIPVVTGGSEFVQLQEDGLPTVLFGDMNFGNNDYWIRYDNSVERVEAVRGGGASTFASQAPGAVINYISKTGKKEGGTIGLTTALGYKENRLDFEYGAPINDTLRFHIGGFLRNGNGPTNIDYNALAGYQIKGNITKELANGKGYFRLNFKSLDDKAPTYTSAPSLVSLSGNKISDFQPMSNFDARKNSNQSIYNQTFKVLNWDGSVQNTPMEGIHVKANTFGGEFNYKFDDRFTVQDNFRYTSQSGAFRTQFLGVSSTASLIGSTVNGGVVGSVRYANGPKQGQAYTGTYYNNSPNIDTRMRDMGSFVNDLVVTGKFDFAQGVLTAKAGYFHMRQTVDQEWHVNQTYSELSGENPAMLDLFTGPNGTGTQLTAAGQAGFNNNWGSCCARDYALDYVDDAPYLSLNYSGNGLDLDASVRVDNLKASGWAFGGVAGPNVTVTDNLGSAILPSLVAGGVQENLNYEKSYTSYSVGALYSLNNNLSIFGRISKGGRFNADRRILGGNFNADGSLNAQGDTTAVNFIEQQEIGLKNRGNFMGASYNFEATYFRAQLVDNNYDFTRIQQNLNPVISNEYESQGLELSGNARKGNWRLIANATITDAEIVNTGKVPHATPTFAFQISPSYDAGLYAIGASINGQSSTYIDDANAWEMEGQTFVNGFVKYRPFEGLELALNANNLLDTLGYRGSGSLYQINSTQGIIQNSAVLGRTITASVRYSF